jgi:predicted phosphodiesterase
MKLLIISDIHANWPALRAVLEAEPDVGEILCLGDLVDYGPEPRRCVEWALAHVAPMRLLQGNHDWAVGWDEDPRCSAPYRHLAEVTRKHCLRVFTEGLRSFLCELWPQRSLSLGNANGVACHAVPSDPRFQYLTFAAEPSRWIEQIEQVHSPNFLFVGHTHLPGKRQIGKTLVVNPGSVGQPKDGDPRAAYAIWQDGEVELRRAAYDVEETIRAYAATPFPEEVIASLAHVLRTGGSLPHEMEAEASA